ncbi:MAG: T9SS type A sorting domain-containing protein [Bacteroidia bacterium]|nr:T9SS type A sorting domain-containing protein [Bacteroidia bacterium]
MRIVNNPVLKSIYALGNVGEVGQDLIIENNPALSICCGVYPILNFSKVGGTTTIQNNDLGCNTDIEILKTQGPCLQITGYSLIDAKTDSVLGSLENADVIVLDSTRQYTLEAHSPEAGSVVLELFLNDVRIHAKQENFAPFALFANEDQDFFPGVLSTPTPGQFYRLVATPYSQKNRRGIRGPDLSIVFSFAAPVSAPASEVTPKPSVMGVHPNPNPQVLYYHPSQPGEQARLYIYNQTGKLVLEQSLRGTESQPIDLKKLGKGLFYSKLVSPEGVITQTLLLE